MGLRDYIKANRQRAMLVLFLITLTQLTTTMYTYLTSPQLNAIASGKFKLFLELIFVQFLIGQVCNVSFNWGSLQNTKQTQTLFHQVRQRIIRHYYQQPEDKVSEMENHLGNDLQLVQESYYNVYFYFVCDLIYIILTIGTLFTFHWILVVYTLLVTLLAVVVPKLTEKYTNRATKAVSIQNKQFLQLLEKWFKGLDELRRYQNKVVLKKVVGQQSQKLEQSEYQRDKLLHYTSLVSAIFNIAGRVGVPFIAGILFFNHQVNLGAILTAGYFANGIFYSVDSCVNRYTQLKSTKTLRDDLAKLQKCLPEKGYDSLKQIATVQIKSLSVQYPNGERITYPDFELKNDEKVLLTGDSGTGKSTLLKLILGELQASRGKIQYFNQKGEKIQPDLAEIGYLPQDPVLFPVTIVENITMFNSKLLSRVKSAIEKVQFAGDIAKFSAGIETKIDLDQLNVSGGQRQKIVLARSMVHQSKLILIDEATSAIDQAATMKILRQLTKTDATIVFIAHNFNQEMHQLFDREIHLKK